MSGKDKKIADSIFEAADQPAQDALDLFGVTVRRAKALFRPVCVKLTGSGNRDVLDEYRIALVPFKLCIRTLRGEYTPGGEHALEGAPLLQERQFDHFSLCVNTEERVSDVEDWCSSILTRVQSAVGSGADFVVLPELSYPSFWPGSKPSGLQSFDRRRRLMNARSELDTKLQELATNNGAIIVGGSYHDWETFENVSLIYMPAAEETRSHKKVTSAYNIGEQTKTTQSVTYPVYELEDNRRFCILVCSDAFDLNMFFRQIFETHSGHAETTPNIIFVPSFYVREDRRHAMKDACQQLSRATGHVVVFVNQGDDTDRCAVFIAGDEARLDKREDFFVADIAPDDVTSIASKHGEMRRRMGEMLRATRTF